MGVECAQLAPPYLFLLLGLFQVAEQGFALLVCLFYQGLYLFHPLESIFNFLINVLTPLGGHFCKRRAGRESEERGRGDAGAITLEAAGMVRKASSL